MRYMVMHKVDAKMEAGEPPSPDIIQSMGQLVGRSLKEGIFKDGAGLHPSAKRARVTFPGGKPSVQRGPYAGGNELTASLALITTTGFEKAIEYATLLGEAAGRREIEIGPVVEGWDLTGKPRPANAPHRFLLLTKGDAAYESGAAQAPAIRALLDQWKRDGVLESETNLKPTKTAVRYKASGGKRTWIDGPFTESKELVAGFSVLEVPSLDDAKRFTIEYAGILGDNEIDIREVLV
jgi:hypothetical protein